MDHFPPAMAQPQAPDRPATAFVAFRGKTLFERLGDPRIGLHPADADGNDADFIVIPYPYSTAGHDMHPGLARMLADEVPDALIRRLRDGLATVVFDASAEGYPHSAARSDWIHQGLAELGVAADACLMITQERNYAADYAEYAARRGVRERVGVAAYDLWIKRFHDQFEVEGEKWHRKRLKAFRARQAARSRRFISLNLTARAMKVLFLLRLIKDDLWDSGHISFGGFDRRLNDFDPAASRRRRTAADFLQEKLGSHHDFRDMVEELAPCMESLEAKGQLIIGEVRQDGGGRIAKSPFKDLKLDEYDDSWFSVVTETEMRDRPSRITEKPFKPLANFHPLIVLGNPGSLRMIREFGYRTFDGAIDESYDEEPDPRRRFDMAYAEFVRLCRMDADELVRFEASLAETLAYNARWALLEMPRIYREQRDVALADQLLAMRARARARASTPAA